MSTSKWPREEKSNVNCSRHCRVTRFTTSPPPLTGSRVRKWNEYRRLSREAQNDLNAVALAPRGAPPGRAPPPAVSGNTPAHSMSTVVERESSEGRAAPGWIGPASRTHSTDGVGSPCPGSVVSFVGSTSVMVVRLGRDQYRSLMRVSADTTAPVSNRNTRSAVGLSAASPLAPYGSGGRSRV